MKKHLFLICPTDNLETTINKFFKNENFFCTSLANTIQFKNKEVEEINNLILSKGISEISLILSSKNSVVKNVFLQKSLLNTNNINFVFETIFKNTNELNGYQTINNKEIQFIINHLKTKTNEFSKLIDNWILSKININSKIYFRKNNLFVDNKVSLLYNKKYYLN